jgi:hypothetical protein
MVSLPETLPERSWRLVPLGLLAGPRPRGRNGSLAVAELGHVEGLVAGTNATALLYEVLEGRGACLSYNPGNFPHHNVDTVESPSLARPNLSLDFLQVGRRLPLAIARQDDVVHGAGRVLNERILNGHVLDGRVLDFPGLLWGQRALVLRVHNLAGPAWNSFVPASYLDFGVQGNQSLRRHVNLCTLHWREMDTYILDINPQPKATVSARDGRLTNSDRLH